MWKQNDVQSMLKDRKKELNQKNKNKRFDNYLEQLKKFKNDKKKLNIEDYNLLRNCLSAAHSTDSPIDRKKCTHKTIKGTVCKKYAIKIKGIFTFIMI